jgi:hypothetical protein
MIGWISRTPMRTALRVMTGLAGLFFLVIGVTFLVAPGRLTPQFALFPDPVAGYNSLRGDFGGHDAETASLGGGI